MSNNRKLGDLANVLDDGTEGQVLSFNASGKIAASTISTEGTLGTLTQSFDSNQTSSISLSSAANTVPFVSVFKEIPQLGISNKGQWDVNSNGTNYDFYNEKPISYSSSTLTPSATGDGTFTNSNAIVTGYDISLISSGYVRQINSWDYTGAQQTKSVEFSSNGTKIYFCETNNDKIKVFSLTTAYDITTIAGAASSELSVSPVDPYAVRINSSGTKLWVAYDASIEQFTLSTAHDLSTASSDGTWTVGTYIRDIRFNNNGAKIYIADWSSDDIKQYSLTSAYDITGTKSLDGSITGLTNPTAILFNNDGSKLYYGKDNDNDVFVKNLGTAYDITTNVSDGTTVAYDSSANANNWPPKSMAFNSDGTRLFILHIYNASPFHRYLSEFTSGSTNAFNSSDVGKKVVGNSGSAVITGTSGTYKSVTAFADTSAISSWQLFGAEGKADGSGIELSGTSQVGTPLNHGTYNSTSAGITYTGYYSLYSNGGAQYGSASHFGPDGTKFYSWTSSTNVRIWSPTTAFDISTLGNSVINVGGFSANGGQCIRFSKTGDKVFHLGSNGYSLHSYDLSTPYDLSTKGSVTTKTMSFQGTGSVDTMGWYQNNVTVGSGGQHMGNFVISPDGSYFVGECRTVNGALVRGVMSTPYDISTLVLNQSLARGVGITAPGTQSARNRSGSAPAWNQGGGIWFSDDGKLALWWGSAAVVEGFQYRFSTGWDFSTTSGVYDGTTNNMGWSPPAPSGNSSRDVGTTAIEIGTKPDGQVIMQATLFWNNSALSPEQSVIVSYNLSADPNSSSIYPYSVYSPALTNSSNGQINSSSWQDINSMTADETKNGGDIFYAVSTDNRTSWGVAKASDGVRKIAKNNSGTWQYNNDAGTTVSVGYDLSNASYTTISPLLAQSEGYEYMHFKPDGTKVWIGGPNQDTIYEYDLSTGFDLSTISYGRSFAFSTSSQSQGFFMKSDGTRAYISDYTSDIFQLDLSTAWDITTASYSSVVLNLGSGNYSKDIYIKSDGTKLYNVANNNVMKQFTMATPWDLSTATLDHTVTLADSFTYGSITFNSDGTILFIAHVNTSPAALRAVNSYSLSTAWDISSTLTLITNYDIFPEIGGHIASGIGFNGDGSKMYIMSAENTTTSPGRRILEYSTGSTTINYSTSETWVNGTNNNEHATLQEALGAQSFNRMNKAQLDAVADGYHFSQDSADTLDLMIAPYAASGSSPISDGVTINYDAEAIVREAIPGTDYIADFPNNTTINIKSLVNTNMKVRAL